MIQIENVSKRLGEQLILDKICAHVPKGSIYGLLGTNGAGKSTLLNLMSGVYKPDEGKILYEGAPVWENPAVKCRVAYVSDEPFFFSGSSMDDMASYLVKAEPKFTMEKYKEVKEHFPLDSRKKLSTFSKGMKRQAAILLALAQSPDVLLMDESFDGLDPVIRQLVKRLLIEEQQARGMTTVLSSHNLREMENLCDIVTVIHGKNIMFERSIAELKDTVHKIQLAFSEPVEKEVFHEMHPLSVNVRGRVVELVVRGKIDEQLAKAESYKPLFAEKIEINLEDIFVYEMEATGYDFSKLLQ